MCVLEFEDEFQKKVSNASDTDLADILKMAETVKSLFKKSSVWSSKKLVKYVPQRLKEVIVILKYFISLNCICVLYKTWWLLP